MREPTCVCTELNRQLLAHLLRQPEGEVHEDACRRAAFAQGRVTADACGRICLHVDECPTPRRGVEADR